MPSKEKQNEARRAKKEGGEKAKSKSQDCCVTFKPKTRNHLEILLSEHARTSQANILHLDQKAAKCQHDSDRNTNRLASKRVFRQNLLRRMG